jgi:hypothetical protein
MLSTIVFCEDEPDPAGCDRIESLARTLGSLIAAKVEGILRDVAIAGPRAQGLDALADHAGCGLIEAEAEAEWLRLAVEAARGPDLLLLRFGHAPEAGFIEEAGDFLARGGRQGAHAARLHAAPDTIIERLFPDWAPLAGLIAPRALCLAAPSCRFRTLARSVRPAVTLRVRARRIG